MKNLYKSLAGFQQEVPAIHEGTKGYGYTYADLKTILKVINPYMKKHGLGFTQLLEGDSIITTIFHSESGESLSSKTNMPQGVTLKGMNAFQVAGASISYFRRYALSSALALVTDVDSDAKGEQVKENATPEQEQYLFKLAENYDIKAMTKSKNMINFSKQTLQKAKEILNQKGNK